VDDDHSHREPRPDGKSQLDRELTPNDLLAGIIDRVLRPVTDGTEQPLIIVDRQFGPDAERSRQARRLGQVPPMIVDAVDWPRRER
jgi:hypothetical protein